jgi:hypothetical protein
MASQLPATAAVAVAAAAVTTPGTTATHTATATASLQFLFGAWWAPFWASGGAHYGHHSDPAAVAFAS